MQAASLFLLATAPFAAAHVMSDQYYLGQSGYSNGSCYDKTADITTCVVEQQGMEWTDCVTPDVYSPAGHVGTDGCCHCDSNCDHSKEMAVAGTCNYADTNAGSCKNAATDKVTCDVTASQCTGANTWSAASALDTDGCCFCDETCDHSLETGTDCHLGPYADISQSDGSCYDFAGEHMVQCDMGADVCKAQGSTYLWYAPGYISATSGCCHCDASCDHSLETGSTDWPDCSLYYIKADLMVNLGEHGTEYTMPPTTTPISIDAATSTTVGVLAAAAAGVASLL